MNKEIIKQEKVSYIATGYELISVSYSNTDRICKAKINLLSDDGQKYDHPEIVLWEGDDYDIVGQFTDQDVEDRIVQVIDNI